MTLNKKDWEEKVEKLRRENESLQEKEVVKCPDCKIKMDRVCMCANKDGELIAWEDSYWKCPKCKIEVEEED